MEHAYNAGLPIAEAFETAAAHLRVQPGTLVDPRDDTSAPVVVSRQGVEAVDPSIFDAYRAAPLRLKGTAKMDRLDSFIAHVNRFKDASSAVFATADPRAPKMEAVLDYSPAQGEPRFAGHRTSYAFPLSPEWQAWFGQDGKAMSMVDFASFLEDHIVDVLAEPGAMSEAAQAFVTTTGGKFATPSKLVEIARGLQVNETSVVKETRNLSSGEAEITFDTQHTGADGKPLKMPNLFVIAIPVFARAAVSYRLLARLRYRKQGGQLLFFYDLWRPDLVFNDAFEEAAANVERETGLPVFMGTPEA